MVVGKETNRGRSYRGLDIDVAIHLFIRIVWNARSNVHSTRFGKHVGIYDVGNLWRFHADWFLHF